MNENLYKSLKKLSSVAAITAFVIMAAACVQMRERLYFINKEVARLVDVLENKRQEIGTLYTRISELEKLNAHMGEEIKFKNLVINEMQRKIPPKGRRR